MRPDGPTCADGTLAEVQGGGRAGAEAAVGAVRQHRSGDSVLQRHLFVGYGDQLGLGGCGCLTVPPGHPSVGVQSSRQPKSTARSGASISREVSRRTEAIGPGRAHSGVRNCSLKLLLKRHGRTASHPQVTGSGAGTGPGSGPGCGCGSGRGPGDGWGSGSGCGGAGGTGSGPPGAGTGPGTGPGCGPGPGPGAGVGLGRTGSLGGVPMVTPCSRERSRPYRGGGDGGGSGTGSGSGTGLGTGLGVCGSPGKR